MRHKARLVNNLPAEAKVVRVYRPSVPICFLAALWFAWPSIGAGWLRAADERMPTEPSRAAATKIGEATPRESRFNLDVNLVLVNVSVMTPMGRSLTGLGKQHFRIFEDSDEQEIAYLASEDAPISVGIIFDCSGSMGQKMAKSREALGEFFRTANPQDEFFLIELSERPRLMVDFTSRPEEIQDRIASIQPKGLTALLDSIHLGLSQMKQAKKPRKALLIISDGGDNFSRYTESEVRRLVKESDVQIYAIGMYEPASIRGRTPEELSGPDLLTELAEQSGGRQFAATRLSELPDIASQISLALRNQYLLGYIPTNAKKDGKWRRIHVKLNGPHGAPPRRVSAKQGYYAPAQ